MSIPSREIYEGGGWKDGRLGQAYDLIDAVMSDHHDATVELRIDLRKARDLEEMSDQFIGQLEARGEPA